MSLRFRGPKQNEWRNDQIARRIAQPPRHPDRAVVCPSGQPAERETCYAEDWTNERAQNGDECEFENTLWQIEDACASSVTIDQPRAANGFQRVAHGDPEARYDAAHARGIGDVNKKRAEENRRPSSVAEQEENGECYPGRRPYWRRTSVEKRQV